VIYVDLWSDVHVEPTSIILGGIRKTVDELQTAGSKLLERLSLVHNVTLGPISLGIHSKDVGAVGEISLPEALQTIVSTTGKSVALLIDEAQQALSSDTGRSTMLALKSARDLVNTDPSLEQSLFIIGTGSHRAMVAEMSSRRNEAFHGAQMQDFPVLEKDFVRWTLEVIQNAGVKGLPTLDCAYNAFKTLGFRPSDLQRALLIVTSTATNPDERRGLNPDSYMFATANALRSAAADIEISQLEEQGQLACLVFDQIAKSSDGAKGLMGTKSLEHFSGQLDRSIRFDEVQSALRGLVAKNLVMRRRHGVYVLTDPFVGKLWLEHANLQEMLLDPQLPLDGLGND
jgi:hypothetical protein